MTITAIVLLCLGTAATFVLGVSMFAAESDRRRVIYASDLDEQTSGWGRLSSWTERQVLRTSAGRRLRRTLDRADVSWTVGTVVLAAMVVMVLVWLIADSLGGPVLAVIGVIGVVMGLRAFLRYRIEKRRQKFVDQLPELARLLANATQAGLALRAALGVAAQESVEPVRSELEQVNRELVVGADLDEVLGRLADRMPSREVQVLVNVLAIQVRAGGRVVTALRGITDALETRREVRREVNTLLAGTKATVAAVAGLGAFMLLLVNMFAEGGLRTVLEDPIGIVLFAVCGGVFGLGLLLVKRFGTVDV
ncbi:type II secretion system F family protein [Nocardioides conyzicola]|uniref:Type II secretion system F family protein n=1 Tax=Nocardioides conyzicola TaxID=1651781 RepID=A0ABP8XBH6_9ACTN